MKPNLGPDARQADSLPEPSLDVTFVVLYYNPGNSLRATVGQMIQVLDRSGMTYEIIAVSDGSTDGSPFTLRDLPEDLVRPIELQRNGGKDHALRAGLAMGRGRYLGFIDADGDISPELLAPFVWQMRVSKADIIIGSKRHALSSVHYPSLRRLYSWGYQLLIHLLFGLDVHDTQVEIKLVDRRVMAEVLPLMKESRFALDLELLVLAQQLGHENILEAPVRIEERFTSTISIRAIWSLLIDTFTIFARLKLLNSHGRAILKRHAARARRQPAPAKRVRHC